MRKLILLGALVLPLLGAGVAQAAEGDLPADCAITATDGSAIQCIGQVAVQDILDFLGVIVTITGSGTPL